MQNSKQDVLDIAYDLGPDCITEEDVTVTRQPESKPQVSLLQASVIELYGAPSHDWTERDELLPGTSITADLSAAGDNCFRQVKDCRLLCPRHKS